MELKDPPYERRGTIVFVTGSIRWLLWDEETH